MSLSFRSLYVSPSEATLRDSIESDHHQDLIVYGITPDSIHQNRLQARVGDAILQLEKQKVIGLGGTVVAGMWYLYVNVPVQSNIRCA
jgi:hypothetical protein